MYKSVKIQYKLKIMQLKRQK